MSETDGARSGKWRDLAPRLLSAVVLVAIGLGAVLTSHLAFSALVLVAGLIGLWELQRMGRAKQRASGFEAGDWQSLVAYLVILIFGCLGLLTLSAEGGRGLLLAVIGLVAVTDTMGYLVGKSLGGPKFWPRVSPNKTWSGIIGGWLGAAVFAFLIHPYLPDMPLGRAGITGGAMLLSFASQLGDMAESALKRRMGVKDSSHIIPGHGGVLDRFDALLALGALAFVLYIIFG